MLIEREMFQENEGSHDSRTVTEPALERLHFESHGIKFSVEVYNSSF